MSRLGSFLRGVTSRVTRRPRDVRVEWTASESAWDPLSSSWSEHPREVRLFRHTTETLNAPWVSHVVELHPELFAFRLPFDLPVPNGAHFVLRRSNDLSEPPWVQLAVRRISIAPTDALLSPYEQGLAALMGETKPRLHRGHSNQTWVFATTLNALFADEPIEVLNRTGEGTTLGFERCLAAVNLLSETSRLLTGEIDSRPLAKEALDSHIALFSVDPWTGSLGERRMFHLHNRKVNPQFVVDQTDGMDERIRIALGRRLEADAAARPHPFVMARILVGQAWSQRWHGEAAGSIITLHTAVESLLRGLLEVMLVDANLGATEVERAGGISFRKLWRSRLPNLLFGRWTGTGAVPEQYMSDVYSLRNGIVHDGHEPPWWKLNSAFDEHDTLVEFLDRRILCGWRDHPRTLTAWCEEWAGGTLKLPSAAQAVADVLRSEKSPYWLPHDLAGR